MKMHDQDEESIIPEEKQGSWDWKWSDDSEGLEFEVFGSERKENLSREIEGNEWELLMAPFYRNPINLDRSRAIEL